MRNNVELSALASPVARNNHITVLLVPTRN